MINKTAVHIISRLLVLCSSCQCWSSLCCSRLTSGWRKGHDEPRGWLIGQCVYEVYRPHEYKDYYIIPWYVPVFPVFFHPIYCFRPTSPPASLSCQIRGHIAGTPPPLLRCVPSFLSREEFSIFFSRRLTSNRAYTRCYQVSATWWSTLAQEKVLGGIRTHAIDLLVAY